CTANMHQGWPKLVQNLWYQTADQGIAALIYGPSEATISVANGQSVHMIEDTRYPYEETIRFTIKTNKNVRFPLHFRIPQWATNAAIAINGKPTTTETRPGSIAKITQMWKDGDEVTLTLPMHIETSRWAESSVAVERGPLVYALKIEEDWQKVTGVEYFGDFYDVYPRSDWNYGLLESTIKHPETGFEVVNTPANASYPWNLDG